MGEGKHKSGMSTKMVMRSRGLYSRRKGEMTIAMSGPRGKIS